MLFKTGDSVDFQFSTDPKAKPDRNAAVPGDRRLLVAPFQDRSIAVLYSYREPGAKSPMSFSSPSRSEVVDRVTEIKSAKVAMTPGEGFYTVTVSIPLAELGLPPGRQAADLRGDFGVIYGDAAGSMDLLRSYWSNQATGLVNDVPCQNWLISKYDPVSNLTAPMLEKPVTGLRDIALLPDGGVVGQIEGKLNLFRDGKPVTQGWPRPLPFARIQLLDSFWYGTAWHGTIRRYNSEVEADPGVVLGGGSGSFIGHVDGNTELEFPHGLAKLRSDLFAVSGLNGVLHLLNWDQEKKQFSIVRRIGAVPICQGLGINRQGQVWFNSGHWNWNDDPASELHECSGAPDRELPGIGQVVMLPNDNFVAPSVRGGQATVFGGPFSWKANYPSAKNAAKGPKSSGFLNGSAVFLEKSVPILIAINARGEGRSYRINNLGDLVEERNPVKLEPKSPVKEWTSLALKDNDTLLGAGDGFVIEMTRAGDNWKESRRWNSWNGTPPCAFGARIYICADAGKLWVVDSACHRVLCFTLADSTLRASFGVPNQPGTDLAHLNAPASIAAREMRAIVFDSANQRLMKLILAE